MKKLIVLSALAALAVACGDSNKPATDPTATSGSAMPSTPSTSDTSMPSTPSTGSASPAGSSMPKK